MASQLFEILAPTFVCAFSGWVWVRSGRSFDRKMIGDLIALIGAPCLIFSSLVSLEASPEAMWQMARAALVAFGAFGVSGVFLLRMLKLPLHTYLAPLTFGNQGNMGVPRVPVCLWGRRSGTRPVGYHRRPRDCIGTPGSDLLDAHH